MTTAAGTLTSSTTLPEALTFGANHAWIDAAGNDMPGMQYLRTVLSNFQDGLDLALIFGSDGSGVDATFYSETSGGYWLWDASDNQLEAVESKLTMTTATETATDPGRQIYLQRTYTGTMAAGKGLTGIEVRSTFNGAAAATTGEIKGGEFKARHTAANTKNVATMKGVIGNVDSKSGAKTITSAWAVEGQIDCGVSSTITTAAGLRVAYNEDGTVTNAYGVYVDGTSTWDIGVYCVGGKSTTAIQVGEDGEGGGDVKFYGATSGCYQEWDESADRLNIIRTSAATSGTLRSANISQTMTAASTGNIVEALYVKVTSDVKTGQWANAIVGAIDYSTNGAAHGTAAGVCAELTLPNSSLARGSLYCLDMYMSIGATSSWASAGPVAFMKFEAGGTVAQLLTNGYLFHVKGVTAENNGLFDDSSSATANATLKIRVGTTDYFILLSTSA